MQMGKYVWVSMLAVGLGLAVVGCEKKGDSNRKSTGTTTAPSGAYNTDGHEPVVTPPSDTGKSPGRDDAIGSERSPSDTSRENGSADRLTKPDRPEGDTQSPISPDSGGAASLL